ncbi:MAG: Trk family potassium uptake protein [Eubacterium coprostanoligenes]|uniref:TrkH family potassium uptake protein n=1 Tax=Eubacterium coprostanoligenes TaxID=290054 RepID=UPI002355CCF9|nr:potassium transporter TrkG [Eubacterium coprostanoligenes]MCI7265397.1 Trk family potassium uptake protein [Eubacterium coprostanoligenes]
MPKKSNIKKRLSTFQIILLGFAGVILLGALLLMLPISSAERVVTPFNEALFTSTSAVCVTGLVVKDTGNYWSAFGQAIIITLIQIGGLGVVTIAASFSMLAGRRISLMQRSTMQDAISAPKVGGIVKLTKFIITGTFIIEAVGAVSMMPVFCKNFGAKGIWMSIFHSISAFCNAGFDILGTKGNQFCSLTSYTSNPVINITVMLLIVIGGIGFLTWDDIYNNKFKIKKYRMQSKIILVTSLILILLPAIYFFIFDYSDYSIGNRLLASLFQSVTTRTAGFNTTDLTKLTRPSQAIMIFLMLVGGSPGSTAGGLKTTTMAVLILNAFACFKRKEHVCAFGRRIDDSVIKSAATIVMMYITLFFIGGVSICTIEKLPLVASLFETASAIGTVGLTLGITPKLSLASQIILIILMYLGRVGGLTLIYATLSVKKHINAKMPLDKITVG